MLSLCQTCVVVCSSLELCVVVCCCVLYVTVLIVWPCLSLYEVLSLCVVSCSCVLLCVVVCDCVWLCVVVCLWTCRVVQCVTHCPLSLQGHEAPPTQQRVCMCTCKCKCATDVFILCPNNNKQQISEERRMNFPMMHLCESHRGEMKGGYL